MIKLVGSLLASLLRCIENENVKSAVHYGIHFYYYCMVFLSRGAVF